MRFKKIIRGGLALGIMMGCSYSAPSLAAPSKDKTHSHEGYYKPGAAVELTYDYDGHTQPGELESLTLTLQHAYSEGYISARLLDTTELHILPYGSLENEKVHAGSALQLPLQLSGIKFGEYFISLEIIYESLSGHRSLRVLSLPVQIGNIEATKTKGANARSQSSKPKTENGLIILNAQEVIK